MSQSVRFHSQPDLRPEYAGLRHWGLFDGIVFGPVESRRFGRSLGINPLPRDQKICSFDCPYCECGRTVMAMPAMLKTNFPTVEQIRSELDLALETLQSDPPDHLTLTGNGEPTMHPRFDAIVETVIDARTRHALRARIAVLTNGTFIGRPSVAAALDRVDVVMLKLDAGTPEAMKAIDLPLVTWTPERVRQAAGRIPGVIIQAIFLRGSIDNTSDAEVAAWLSHLDAIRPASVVIYTLDRVPPQPGLQRVPESDLERIRERVEILGIPCERL